MAKSSIDWFKEYNRIRRNMLQQSRRHNIEPPKILTATQLQKQSGKKISKSDVVNIEKRRADYHTVIQAVDTKHTKSTIKLNYIPKKSSPFKPPTTVKKKKSPAAKSSSKPKKTKSSKPKTQATPTVQTVSRQETEEKDYKDIYAKYGSEFTVVTNTGDIVDRFTGEVLGVSQYSEFAAEDIGKYLDEKYGGDNNFESPYDKAKGNVSQLDAFVDYIQARVDKAIEDSDLGLHGSRQAAKNIQDALNEFDRKMNDKENHEGLVRAAERYDKFETQIKEYLDEAIYYAENGKDESSRHLIALAKIMDLLDLDFDTSNLNFNNYDATIYTPADFKYMSED